MSSISPEYKELFRSCTSDRAVRVAHYIQQNDEWSEYLLDFLGSAIWHLITNSRYPLEERVRFLEGLSPVVDHALVRGAFLACGGGKIPTRMAEAEEDNAVRRFTTTAREALLRELDRAE